MAGILAETDADPQSVVLELTETGQIDTVRGLTVLQELKVAGVRWPSTSSGPPLH